MCPRPFHVQVTRKKQAFASCEKWEKHRSLSGCTAPIQKRTTRKKNTIYRYYTPGLSIIPRKWEWKIFASNYKVFNTFSQIFPHGFQNMQRKRHKKKERPKKVFFAVVKHPFSNKVIHLNTQKKHP